MQTVGLPGSDAPTYRTARALIVCIIAAITITVFYRSNAFPPVDRSLSDAAIVLLPLVGFILSIGRLWHRAPSPVAVTFAAVYAVAVTLSGIINGPGMATVFGMLLPAMTAAVLVLVGSLLTTTEFRIIARWVIFLAIVQACFAVAEVQLLEPWARAIASTNGLYPFRANLILQGIGRANGAMGHPILLGLVCTLGALLALSRTIVKRNLFRITIIAFLVWGVVLSGSRSSLAACLVAGMLYFLHRASPTRGGARVLMVLAIVPITVIYVNEAVEKAREVSLFSLTNRIDAVPRLFDTVSRPFPHWAVGDGVGFSLDTVADNQFVTTSGAYGLIGLIALTAAVIYGLFSPSPVAVASLGALVFMSLSFDTLTWAFSAFMLWFLVGYAHSGSAVSSIPGDNRPGIRDTRRVPRHRFTSAG